MSGCDHHLTKTVHRIQLFGIDLQYPFTVGDQFDLALPGLGAVDILTSSGLVEQGGSFVLVEDVRAFFSQT